ncbi:MAG: Gfo/Idh/MocA family oxidoreductase [Christensenellaceae bacterium]|nr:Gfo/Idh/MocA family oxidoreductase [Christensenellaceae bacterium]
MKIALIGLGNRGRIYANNLHLHSDVQISALCDKNASILESCKQTYGLKDDAVYISDDDFFAAGKLADALVIATQDKDHYRHAIKALDLGYHLLLEKPVSPDWNECLEITRLAKEKNLNVVVCHVLRYSAFYDKIKSLIDSGIIGEVVSINDIENVAYWHFSHSYVRGNWRNSKESGPTILTKCCHDLDLIYYFSGAKCKELYSTSSRKLFLNENAPDNATDYCLDPCPNRKKCPYDVKKIYYGITRHTLPLLLVKIKLITGNGNPRYRDLKEALKTSPYGRCVYKCDNDVVENQVVTMRLENNVNATLTMTAFSKSNYRRIHIFGTKGEIFGNDKSAKLELKIFGGPSKTVKVKAGNLFNHFGGDSMLVNDFLDFLRSGVATTRLSTIEDTLESHRLAFAAEDSRKFAKTIIFEDEVNN